MNTKCLKEQIHIGTNLTCLCCNYSPTISRGNPELWKFCPSCGVMWNGVFEIDAEKRNERQHNKNQGIKKTKWLVTYTEIGRMTMPTKVHGHITPLGTVFGALVVPVPQSELVAAELMTVGRGASHHRIVMDSTSIRSPWNATYVPLAVSKTKRLDLI